MRIPFLLILRNNSIRKRDPYCIDRLATLLRPRLSIHIVGYHHLYACARIRLLRFDLQSRFYNSLKIVPDGLTKLIHLEFGDGRSSEPFQTTTEDDPLISSTHLNKPSSSTRHSRITLTIPDDRSAPHSIPARDVRDETSRRALFLCDILIVQDRCLEGEKDALQAPGVGWGEEVDEGREDEVSSQSHHRQNMFV